LSGPAAGCRSSRRHGILFDQLHAEHGAREEAREGSSAVYSREREREAERELVRERKQLKGQDDIEKALFDYTVYPAALFRKDATLKSARGRDAVLVASQRKPTTKNKKKKEPSTNEKEKSGDADDNDDDEDDDEDEEDDYHKRIGPQFIKSDYYDRTVTKPRPPVLGWCQAIARKGLCTLYGDYFRTSNDVRCLEACGMKKNFSKLVDNDNDDDDDKDKDTSAKKK